MDERQKTWFGETIPEGQNKIIENGKVVRIDIKKSFHFAKGRSGPIIKYKIKEYRR